MGAQQSTWDQDAFNKRVGRATIAAAWFGGIAIVVGIVAIIVSLPRVQRALDDRVLGALAWLTATWTLPWPAWVALLLIIAWAGMRLGRRIAMPAGSTPSQSGPVQSQSPAKAKESPPPKPQQLPRTDRLVLAGLAIAHEWINETDLAAALDLEKLSTRAALLRLGTYKLVLESNAHWLLSDKGTMYVDEHKEIVMQRS